MASPAPVKRITELAGPLAESAGLLLEEVTVRPAGRRLLIQITVDSEAGIDLDAIATLSRAIDRAIEETGALGEQGYTLEVSSPGVDRALKLPRHFRANRGRLVRFTMNADTEFTGRIKDATDSEVLLVDAPPVPIADIVSAKVEIEFNRKSDAAEAE